MEELKTIDIKGKKYVEVNERIRYFRENYKDACIETEMLSIGNGVCVMKAVIKNKDGLILATGHAYEKENSSFINKTSYIENCETSAVGRALGILGIGIDTSVASYEEVANAVKQQETKPQVKSDTKVIQSLECKDCGNPISKSESDYSIRFFNNTELCRVCQKKRKEQ